LEVLYVKSKKKTQVSNCPGAELSWCRNVSHRCRFVPVPKCLAFKKSHPSQLHYNINIWLFPGHRSDLLYLAITSIKICSSIVNFFQNFVQYWYTNIVIQLWKYEIAWIFYSILDCFILEGSCYQLLKSILKVQVHCVSFYWHL
jgi:hypothetical protein